MSASNFAESSILQLLLQNVNFANLGDATGVRGSTAAGNLYVSLHTADPGETGTQTTSEAAYTGYARVAVARSSAGWTVSTPATGTSGTFSNAAAINFAACTAGTSTVTYFGIGTDPSAAGVLLLSGALTSPASLAISAGIAPQFAIGALSGTAD